MAATSCPSPLLPETPLLGAIESQVQQLLASRICVEGCCINCYENFHDKVTKDIGLATYIISFFVFVVALFIVISYLVNPRLTINKYAGLQAASIVLVTGVVCFTPFARSGTVICHDKITPNNGYNSKRCMAEAVLFAFGELTMVLSLVMRIMTVFLKVVLKTKDINRYVSVAIIFVPSAVLSGVGARNVVFEGGDMCSFDAVTTWWHVKVPQLIIAFYGIMLLIIILLYVTSIMAQVSLEVEKSKVGYAALTMRQLGTCIKAFFRSVRLLWRTFFCASYLAAIIVTNFFFRSFPWSHTAPVTGQRTTSWAKCILNNADRFDSQDELYSFCEPVDRAQGLAVFRRRSIANLVLIIQIALFLLSEFQVLLFVGWYNILKTPSAIFLRSRSTAILEQFDDSSPPGSRDNSKAGSDSDPLEDNARGPMMQKHHSDAELDGLQSEISRIRRPSFIEKLHAPTSRRSTVVVVPPTHPPPLFAKAQNARINRDMRNLERNLDDQLARYELQRKASHETYSSTSTVGTRSSASSDSRGEAQHAGALRSGSEGQDTLVDPVDTYKSIRQQKQRQSSQDSDVDGLEILDFLKFN